MRSPPGAGIRTDLRGEHRMQRANANTNSSLMSQNQAFSTEVCASVGDVDKCQHSSRVCQTNAFIFIYIYKEIVENKCVGVLLPWMNSVVSCKSQMRFNGDHMKNFDEVCGLSFLRM